jgi:hypothetical protein
MPRGKLLAKTHDRMESLIDRFDEPIIIKKAAREERKPIKVDAVVEADDVFGFSIEVAYLLDMTGSMGAWIRASAQQLQEVTRQIKDTMLRECGSAAHVRFSLIGYRDHCDGPKHFQCYPKSGFTDNVAGVCRALSSASASGGGDMPEDVEGAMRLACALPWSADVRFCMLLTDAPCHGTAFHRFHDDHPNDPTPIPRMLELRNLGVQMVVCPLTPYTNTMIEKFEEAYDDNMDKLITIDMKDQDTTRYCPRVSARFVLKLMGV